MAQVGFFYDMTRCVGCKACQMACKDKNDLEIGIIYRHAESFESGTFPKVSTFCYSFSCNHCASPACFAACTVGAITKMDDGTVVIDEELCNGCQECIAACPYGVPQANEANGTVGKCDGCYELRANGEQNACVSTCAQRAIFFGDLDELKSKHGAGKDLVSDFPALGATAETQPSILVNIKEVAKGTDFKQTMF